MDIEAMSRAELLEAVRALQGRVAVLESRLRAIDAPAASLAREAVEAAARLPPHTRAEARLATQHAVIHILLEATSLAEAAPRVLRAICEGLGWAVGALWRVDHGADLLRCTARWHAPAVDAAALQAAYDMVELLPGADLPGLVWASDRPRWIRCLPPQPGFPRSAAVSQAGLHSAFAIPVRVGHELLGVLECLSWQPHEPSANVQEAMLLICGQIGQFMERKQAEDALRKSEERFALFMRNLPGLAFIKDATGRHLYVNEKHEMLFHWRFSDWYDKTDAELFPAHTAAQFAENDRTVFEQQIVLQTIETIPQAEGLHYYLVNKFPMLDSGGRTVLLGGIGIDITERVQAEDRLQESEERFRQLAENIQGVFWMLDPHERRMIYVSPGFEKIWGRSRADLYEDALEFYAQVHPEDREQLLASLQRQLGGEMTDEEYRILRPDGSVRWIWDRGFPVRDRSGQVFRIAGIADDVTERHRAEQAQRFLSRASAVLSSSLVYETTLSSLAHLAVPPLADWCAVDLLDEQQQVQRLTIACADPDKESIARELRERFPPTPDASDGVARVLRTGQPLLVTEVSEALLESLARSAEHLQLLRALGIVSYLCVPLLARGRTLGAITLVSAESQRRYGSDDLALVEELASRAAVAVDNARLYGEAQQALHTRDQFLSIVAHELKTPITALLSYAQLLERRAERLGATGERDQRALSMLTNQTRRLHRLISSLLDVARIRTGRLTIERSPVEITALVRRVLEEMQPTLERHRLELVAPAEALLVDGDELRLEQALVNLLQNAVKYSPTGGVVGIVLSLQDGMLAIAVSDEGIGIPGESVSQLFSRFYRASNVDQGQIAGMGLGLYVVKEITALHGGTVGVESNEGQGSTFTMLLPCVEQAAADMAGPPAPEV